VLTVVEHDEELLGRQLLEESILRRSHGLVVDPETSGDRGCDQASVPDGSKLDETHARRVPVGKQMAKLHAEPRLAAARGPHQGDQAEAFDDPHQFAGVGFTADEPSQQATTALDHGMLDQFRPLTSTN
jgi:hypothetical protein